MLLPFLFLNSSLAGSWPLVFLQQPGPHTSGPWVLFTCFLCVMLFLPICSSFSFNIPFFLKKDVLLILERHRDINLLSPAHHPLGIEPATGNVPDWVSNWDLLVHRSTPNNWATGWLNLNVFIVFLILEYKPYWGQRFFFLTDLWAILSVPRKVPGT